MSIDSADYHRIALLMKCESVDDVIAWADSEILRSESPPLALIEVSLSRSKSVSEQAALLDTLVENRNDRSALKAVLATIAAMVSDGRLPSGDAIERIYEYAKANDPRSDLRVAFISLAEDLSRIHDGVYWTSDVNALREPLLEAISAYFGANN